MTSKQWPADIVPDLRTVPEDEWKDAMRPLPPHLRRMSVRGLVDDQRARWVEIDLELGAEDLERRMSIRTPQVPHGVPVEAPRRSTRQVNIRLEHAAYERLASIAADLNLKPTQLARLFVGRAVEAYRPTPGFGTGLGPDQS